MTRIAIVDDDEMFAENVAELLRGPDCEVTCLSDTDEAVAALTADPPDLVVLDVMFPEDPAGGFNIARQVRHTEGIKDLPIIMLTGVNQELPADFSSKDIDGEWMPVQDFFEKPPDLEKLTARIHELLA